MPWDEKGHCAGMSKYISVDVVFDESNPQETAVQSLLRVICGDAILASLYVDVVWNGVFLYPE